LDSSHKKEVFKIGKLLHSELEALELLHLKEVQG